MKNIIIFYPWIIEYGGIERNILALSSAIKKRNLKPVLLCFYDKLNMQKFDKGLHVHKLGGKHFNPFVNAAKLRFYLEKNKKNILGMPFFFAEKAAFYAAFNSFFNKYKFVLHYTDPPSLVNYWRSNIGIINFFRKIKRNLALYVTKIGVKKAFKRITMTKLNADELIKVFGGKFNVIYQGGHYLKSRNLNKKRCKSKNLNLFSICRITSSKNIDWIIEAVSYLKNTDLFKSWFKNINLAIAGEGPDKKPLMQLTKKLNLTKSVFFTGFIDDKKLKKIYKKTDLFLVPAKQGYGLPVLESLYREIPVVVNKESRISEIFKKNPWVKITNNNKNNFIHGLCLHLKKIRNKMPNKKYLENLPTEEKWAFKIGVYCNWWAK